MAVDGDNCDERQPLLAGATPIADTPSNSQHFNSVSLLHADSASEYSGGKGQLSEWSEEQYEVGQPDIAPNQIEVSSLGSANEIRAAASKDPYPPWIYGALVTPADCQPGIEHGLANSIHLPHQPLLQGLKEEEIRDLLIDYVSHHRCWGSRPAHSWKIRNVEDCNSYFGSLESFIEERDVLEVKEPYTGEFIDGKKSGRMTGPWEVDMRADFPSLFTKKKTVQVPIPNSEFVARCADCSGKGELPCPSGLNHSGKALVCLACHGRGLIAHMDGSDTNCTNCKGVGKLPCSTCRSLGRITCSKCNSQGALIVHKVLIVTWQTLLTKKVAASSHAASIPDEALHRAKGATLYSIQAQHCNPVNFSNLPGLTKFSNDVLAERSAVPPTARVICERHQINFIPVTRVVMAHGSQSFNFYIVGLSKEIFLKDYPYKLCGGICCCQNNCTIL